MSEAMTKVLPLLDELTPGELRTVRERLDALDGELETDEWEEAWAEEIERRRAKLLSGETRGIPSAEVFREINEMLKNEAARV